MKIKNIAFSGFMAAIMLSAGATAANAKIEIASRQYVDDKETTLNTSITNVANDVTNLTTKVDGKADTTALDAYLKTDTAETTYAKKSDVADVTTTATEAKNAANAAKNAADAAATTANTNKTAIGDAESGLTKDVADAKAAAAAADTKAAGAATAAETAKSAADAAAETANANKAAIENETTGLAATKTIADNAASAAAKNTTDITQLKTDVSGKEDSKNKITEITEANSGSNELFPTVGAVMKKISGLSELPVNPGLIEDGTLDGSKLKDGTVTKTKLSSDVQTTLDNAQTAEEVTAAITAALNDYTNTDDLNAELAKKANSDDVYNKKAVDDKFDTTIPRPEGTCAAESGRCVLSVDAASKNMMWMDVTAPLGE